MFIDDTVAYRKTNAVTKEENDFRTLRRSQSTGKLISYIVALEFVSVAIVSYLGSVFYYLSVLSQWPAIAQYATAAVSIGVLTTLMSIGFRHYVLVQTMSRQAWLWKGIGSVALAFSIFLTVLFLLTYTDAYSRGTFLTQWVAVTISLVALRTAQYGKFQSAIKSGTIETRRALLIGQQSHILHYIALLKNSGTAVYGVFPFPSSRHVEDDLNNSNRELQHIIENIRRWRNRRYSYCCQTN